jgi:hypothetical protein
MGLYWIGELFIPKTIVAEYRINELKERKEQKKNHYKKNPNMKTKQEIININRQINAIRLKSKKKGKSKLRNELV